MVTIKEPVAVRALIKREAISIRDMADSTTVDAVAQATNNVVNPRSIDPEDIKLSHTEKSHVRSHAKISCEILVRELLKSQLSSKIYVLKRLSHFLHF